MYDYSMKAFSWFDSLDTRYTVIADTEAAARAGAIALYNRPDDPTCRAVEIFSKPPRSIHICPTIIVSGHGWPIYEI
jgi:hypothetical protein